MPDESDRPIEIEMASSGQMETWPMVSIAQAMFGWEASQRPLFIHIEEPETHLHPAAQVAITKLLAYLCNKGFRLVITTHSLFVLYVVNNLVLAAQTLPDKNFENIPDSSFRLSPNQLSAYLFCDGTAISICEPESGQLDESKLSSVLGNLEIQYNHIQSYQFLWG
ncbi:MAG: AAA family ATPase [Chroococcales cyanobacterium]